MNENEPVEKKNNTSPLGGETTLIVQLVRRKWWMMLGVVALVPMALSATAATGQTFDSIRNTVDNVSGPCHAYTRYMNLAALINDCACLKVRTAARAVTRLYDDAFRPLGLRATQLSVLVAVAFSEAVSIAALSRMLGMDRSTLTRNLGPLGEKGLVVLGPEGHHRSRTLSITSKGDQLVRKALPLWEKTQEKLREELKKPHWTNLHAELDHVIKSAEVI